MRFEKVIQRYFFYTKFAKNEIQMGSKHQGYDKRKTQKSEEIQV